MIVTRLPRYKKQIYAERLSSLSEHHASGMNDADIGALTGVPPYAVKLERQRLRLPENRSGKPPGKSDAQVQALLDQCRRDEMARAALHPLVRLREDCPADLAYAVAVLKAEGRHGVIRSGGMDHDQIDGRYATPRMKLVEANKVLAREGLAQVGPRECRA